jgi:uncharacterized membrane protein YhaH (DUF805 family)
MAVLFDVLRKSFDFSGRASRKEFGIFFLYSSIIGILLIVVDVRIYLSNPYGGLGIYTILYQLLLFLPNMALMVRRMHDSDQSGWWVLVGIIPFIGFIIQMSFLFAEGTVGPNQYGEDPRCCKSSATNDAPTQERFVPKFNKDE